MIALLSGILRVKDPARIVVDVGGTGYEVLIPLSTFDVLPELGEAVSIHTHLHVRDDALQLFGFSSPEEKQVFTSLINLSGIGPRLALNILSGSPVGQFLEAVESEDVTRLAKIPGLGKKTAAKIVFEMRGKIPRQGEKIRPKDEALSALVNLGYRRAAAEAALAGIDENQPLELQITQALRVLSGG